MAQFDENVNAGTQLRCSFKINIAAGTEKAGYIADFFLYLGCVRTKNEDGTYTFSKPFAQIQCLNNNFPAKIFAVTFSETKGIRVYMFSSKLGYYTWHIKVTPLSHFIRTFPNIFLSDFVLPSMSNYTGTTDDQNKYWTTDDYEDGETEVAVLDYSVLPTVGKTTLRNKLSEVFKL